MDTEKIKIRMVELKLTAKELAEHLGYGHSYVSNVINHPKRSPKLFKKIQQALHEIEISKTSI